MAETIPPIRVPFTGDPSGFNNAAKGVENRVQSMSKALQGLAIGIGGAKLLGFFSSLSDAAAGQIDSLTRLRSSLQAQGRAADTTPYERLANSLQNVTKFGDETTLAMTAMATSAGFSLEQVQAMTPRVADLATHLGGSLNDAFRKVQMAVSMGARSFTSMGIVLSDTEKKQFENADAAGRLSMAMGILDRSVGGMAEAMANTASGAYAQLQGVLGDLREDLGLLTEETRKQTWQALTGAVNNVRGALASLSPGMRETLSTLLSLAPAALAVVTGLTVLAGVLPAVVAGFKLMGTYATAILSPILSVILVVGALATAAAFLRVAWEDNWGGIQDVTRSVVARVRGFFEDVSTDWDGLTDTLANGARFVSDVLVDVFMAPMRVISTLVRTTKTAMASILDSIADLADSPVASILGVSAESGASIRGKVKELRAAAAFEAISFDERVSVLKDVLDPASIVRTTRDALPGFVDAAGEAVKTARRGFELIGGDFMDALKGFFGKEAVEALSASLGAGAGPDRPGLGGGGLRAGAVKENPEIARFAESLDSLRDRVEVIDRDGFRELSDVLVTARQDLVDLAHSARLAGQSEEEVLRLRRRVALDDMRTVVQSQTSLLGFTMAAEQAADQLREIDIDPAELFDGLEFSPQSLGDILSLNVDKALDSAFGKGLDPKTRNRMSESFATAIERSLSSGNLDTEGFAKGAGEFLGSTDIGKSALGALGVPAAGAAAAGGVVGVAAAGVATGIQQAGGMLIDAIKGLASGVAAGISEGLGLFDARFVDAFERIKGPSVVKALVTGLAVGVIAFGLLVANIAASLTIFAGPLVVLVVIVAAVVVVFSALVLPVALLTTGLLALTTQTETFARVQTAMQASVQRVIDRMEPLAEELFVLVGLFDVVMDGILVFADALLGGAEFGPVLFHLFKMFAQGALLLIDTTARIAWGFGQAVIFVLEIAATIAWVSSQIRVVINDMTYAILQTIFQFGMSLGLLSPEMITNLTTAMVDAQIRSQQASQAVVSSALNDMASTVRGMLPDLEALGEVAHELNELSYEEAKARGKALEIQREANRESVNIPQGFRELSARFRAIDPTDGGNIPAADDEGRGNTNVYIENIESGATNLMQLLADIREEAERRGMLAGGSTSQNANQWTGG